MKHSLLIFTVAAFGAMAVSCSKSGLEGPIIPGQPNATPVQVTLASAAPEISTWGMGTTNPGTKTAESLAADAPDAQVHDLWVLQYDLNGNLVGVPYYIAELPTVTPGDGTSIDNTYSNLSARLTSSGTDQHTVHFIANTGSGTLFTLENEVPTLDDLESTVVSVRDGYQPDPAKGMLMLGTYTGVVNSATPISVTLKRLVAKIILRYKSSMYGFEFTSLRLRNVAADIRYCPEPASGSDFPAISDGSHIDYPAEDLTQAGTDGDYKTFTWYVPENLRKATAAVPAAGDRTPDKTDGKATCIEVTGVLRKGENCRKGTLRILLGDLGADGKAFDNFDVRRNTVYTVTADIKGLNEGDYRLTVESFDMSNSAMIQPEGTDSVTFDIRKLTKGWQTTMPALGEDADLRAELLWTDNAALATQLEIRLDKVNGLLTVKSTGTAVGNAVVALYNSKTAGSGEILWSWHAWVTDYKPGEAGVAARAANTAYQVAGGQVHTYGTEFQRVNGTSRVIMDRNLGATKAYYAAPVANDATADQAFGLFYQWGRKDPFPRADGATVNANDNTYNASMMPIYGPNGTPLDAPSDNLSATGFRRADIADVIGGEANTFALAMKNPLLFIYNPDLNRSCDWYAEVKENQNPTLWGDGGVKSPYDPCPKGWRVPPFGTWNDFIYTNGLPFFFPYYENGSILDGGTMAYITNGRFYNNMAWYPATGNYDRVTGKLYTVGTTGNSWSTTSSDFAPPQYGINSKHMRFTAAQNDVASGNNGRRSHGQSVRCIQYVE